MRARTRLVGPFVALGVAVATALATAPAAQADGGGEGGSPGGSSTSRTVGNCRVYGGSGGFGLDCRSYSGSDDTIREILGGDPLPDCWDEPLPAELLDEYAPLISEQAALGQRGRFVLRTCMTGIDPRTLKKTGDVKFDQQVTWVPEGDPGKPALTERQKRLVGIERKSAVIPLPLLVATPTVRPRVEQPVSFAVANAREVGPLTYVDAGTVVRMRARLTRLEITPAPGGPSVSCAGGGVTAGPGDTPRSQPEGCWWTYDRSSAAQPGGTYPVRARARWVVEYSRGGGWLQLSSFAKEQTLQQPVTEIQTVVIR
jgi:hypothetical protein